MPSLACHKRALVGLAAGDALGATLELQRRATFALRDAVVGVGRFNRQPGQWTDGASVDVPPLVPSEVKPGSTLNVDAVATLGA